MEQMRALVKTSPQDTELQLLNIPSCGPGEVLMRVRAAALCGTDLHVFEWNSWAQRAGIKFPFVMGHECCGDVVEVGSGVKDCRVGDKVVAETHIPCGHCLQCLNDEQHICHNLRLYGIHTNGCFATYTVVPAVCVRKIPNEITYEVGSIMEPLGVGLRSAYETEVAGRNVVVLGCGPIGLFSVASSVALGAAKVMAADISSTRLDIAARMGADKILNPQKEDVIKTVLDATGGYGADVVIDASGSVEAIKESFRYLRKGGHMALVGLPGKPIELELGADVVFKEAKIIGIHGRKMFKTWTQMENLLTAGKLNVYPAITHIMPLEHWKEGLELALSGQACKVVYQP